MQIETYLQHSSRLGIRKPLDQSRAREIVFLISMGVVAALLSTFLKTHFRIPGHAILKVVLPISFGFAVIPRKYSGTVMGFSALTTGLFLRFGVSGGGDGVGALTSLVLFGPVLDLSLRFIRHPVSAWFLLALAGLVTNAGAFLVRGGFKYLGRDDATNRLLAEWFSFAMISYAVCGLLAGLICGMMFFRYRPALPETDP